MAKLIVLDREETNQEKEYTKHFRADMISNTAIAFPIILALGGNRPGMLHPHTWQARAILGNEGFGGICRRGIVKDDDHK